MNTKYRYYGNKNAAVKHGGIVTCAVRATGNKNDEGLYQYVMSMAFTQNGLKFDKKFSRALADYRLSLLQMRVDSNFNANYEEDFNSALEARRPHVCKIEESGIGIYKKYTKTYEAFTISDFPENSQYSLVFYVNENKAEIIDNLITEYLSKHDLKGVRTTMEWHKKYMLSIAGVFS